MKLLFISDGICQTDTGKSRLSVAHLRLLQSILGPSSVVTVGLRKQGCPECIGFENHSVSNTRCGVLWNYLVRNNRLSREIRARIKQIIVEHAIDTVFIDESFLGLVAEDVKRIDAAVTVITFFYDIRAHLSRIWLQEYGAKYFLRHVAVLHNERAAVTHSDILITLNARDSELLRRHYGKAATCTLPIYMDDELDTHQGAIARRRDRPVLLFVGANYFPNVKGISWFIENVMPELDAVLQIVGKDMQLLRQHWADEKVEVLGTVDCVAEHYNTADCVVLPIFEGGGMKVKTAEAMMYGKWMFGTNEAFEGYVADTDRLGGLCNTRDEFVTKLRAFLSNLSHNGFNPYSRDCYLKYHDTSVVREELKHILRIHASN